MVASGKGSWRLCGQDGDSACFLSNPSNFGLCKMMNSRFISIQVGKKELLIRQSMDNLSIIIFKIS